MQIKVNVSYNINYIRECTNITCCHKFILQCSKNKTDLFIRFITKSFSIYFTNFLYMNI